MSNLKNRRTGVGTSGLRWLTLGELLQANLPVREPLLEHLMKQSESLMLWAAPGVGKTMAALSIALAVAGGGKFLSWQATRPRPVLYVDGEMHVEDLRDRLATLMDAVEGIDRDAALKNLRILARSYQDPEAPFPDLGIPEGQQEIYARARSMKAELVILDNFSVLASVDDENDASAMQPVLTFLLRMKQAGIATLLVHHSSKGGNNYRGSSKIATTFEAIVGLQPASGIASRYPTAFDLEFTKYRGLKNETITKTTAWLAPDDGGVLRWGWKESEDATLGRLVALVRSCEFGRQEELAKAMGVSTGKLSGLKNMALARELIGKAEWDRCLEAARSLGAEIEEIGDDKPF